MLNRYTLRVTYQKIERKWAIMSGTSCSSLMMMSAMWWSCVDGNVGVAKCNLMAYDSYQSVIILVLPVIYRLAYMIIYGRHHTVRNLFTCIESVQLIQKYCNEKNSSQELTFTVCNLNLNRIPPPRRPQKDRSWTFLSSERRFLSLGTQVIRPYVPREWNLNTWRSGSDHVESSRVARDIRDTY